MRAVLDEPWEQSEQGKAAVLIGPALSAWELTAALPGPPTRVPGRPARPDCPGIGYVCGRFVDEFAQAPAPATACPADAESSMPRQQGPSGGRIRVDSVSFGGPPWRTLGPVRSEPDSGGAPHPSAAGALSRAARRPGPG